MKVLTIWQPWAACIAHGPKRVENRTWAPPKRWRFPFELAIHAAKVAQPDEAQTIIDLVRIWPRVVSLPIERGAVLAIASVVAVGEPDGNHWAFGPVCWQLDNVRTLREPVPCRGAQRLWTLPDEVEAEVRRQLGEMTHELVRQQIPRPHDDLCFACGCDLPNCNCCRDCGATGYEGCVCEDAP